MSKEHIWADWLSTVIKHKKTTYNHFFIDTQLLGDVMLVQHRFEAKPRNGSPLQRKIRKVCEKCNNGWMSDAVNATKPIAESLILGLDTELNTGDQAKLCTWITITSMMAEFTDPQTAKVSPLEFYELERLRAPLPNWTIGIGRYCGQEWSPSRYRHYGADALFNDPINPQLFPINFTTFTLGQMAVHAISSTDAQVAHQIRRGFFKKPLTQIWPIEYAVIHSKNIPVISDHELMNISQVFGKLPE